MKPANIGDRLDQVATPSLLIDLDAFERNLDRMASLVPANGKVRLRPHVKTHKCVEVAQAQIARGAVGVCAQTVAEAEAMVAGGIRDVLLTNQIADASRAARFAALAAHATVASCADDPRHVALLEEAAAAAGTTPGMLVEIDVGQHRCGVEPGAQAVALAQTIARSKHLRFRGLQAYHGSAQHLRDPDARRTAIAASADATNATLAALRNAGLEAEIVGGAGTGTFELEQQAGPWTELQAGSYVFMDADYGRNNAPPQFENVLFVLATCSSVARAGHAVIDAGLKAIAFDSGMPVIVTPKGAVYAGPSDEHGTLDLNGALLTIGARVRMIPGHCDPTVSLHDWLVAVRGDRVEALWQVRARGPAL
ncbi:DSD1 family PLP-dependent enzyme [Roseiterribacter gracilis]|uniref:Alanine racemase n=1 Tax=Roseiterribacter gracilis TaxID=2812848 RepID=A0A8S8XER7_9PROT|nr:alanine racemase [Rhodospirillales bacterium TMPK1]